MAKILMVPGEPPIERTIGGSTFYVAGGRSFVRQRVTPIQPRSAAVRREVNAITDASRAWTWRLTPEERATWSFPCFWGWRGSPWFQAIWSILNWIWEDWGPFGFGGTCPDPICAEGLVVDSAAGTMLVTIGSAVGGDMLGYVGASPPMSPGRVPVLSDTRSLVLGVAPGSIVDVGAAYIARFGRLPTVGSVAIAMRFGDLSDGSSTPVCVTVWPIGQPGELTIQFSPDLIVVLPLFPDAIVLGSWGDTSGLTTSCSWSVIGLTLCSVAIAPNPSGLLVEVALTFTQNALRGTEVVLIRVTSNQTGQIAEGPLEVRSVDNP